MDVADGVVDDWRKRVMEEGGVRGVVGVCVQVEVGSVGS